VHNFVVKLFGYPCLFTDKILFAIELRFCLVYCAAHLKRLSGSMLTCGFDETVDIADGSDDVIKFPLIIPW
jgi:hypothetical protein